MISIRKILLFEFIILSSNIHLICVYQVPSLKHWQPPAYTFLDSVANSIQNRFGRNKVLSIASEEYFNRNSEKIKVGIQGTITEMINVYFRLRFGLVNTINIYIVIRFRVAFV